MDRRMSCEWPVTVIPLRWRRLSREGVKAIAFAAMVSAYVADAFVPSSSLVYQILMAFGKMSFPVFCVLFAQGFPYVTDHWFHLALLAAAAIISEFSFDIVVMHEQLMPEITRQNVMFTWCFVFIMLWIMQIVERKVSKRWLDIFLRAVLVISFTTLLVMFGSDYGEVAVICTVWAYMWSKCSVDPLVSCVCVAFVVAMIYNNYWALLAIPVFVFYNPQLPGSYIRGMFYIAYPVCLSVLSVFRLMFI